MTQENYYFSITSCVGSPSSCFLQFSLKQYILRLWSLSFFMDWIGSPRSRQRSFSAEIFLVQREPPLFMGGYSPLIKLVDQLQPLGQRFARVKFGDYSASFYTSGLLCVVTAFFVLRIGKGKSKVKVSA